jgi:ketosteroid isomerase-like protein
MPGPAVETLRRFGSVEDTGQRYTSLLELFTDDAVYYDPMMGAQRGRDEIRSFMQHMEKVVPSAGVTFRNWTVEADVSCGWATWDMIARTPDGDEIVMPGQSLYRLRDGKVCFVADYLDPVSYARLRPAGPVPNAAAGHGLAAPYAPSITTIAERPAEALLRNFWHLQDSGDYALLAPLFADDAVFTDLTYGRMEGGKAITDFMALMKTEMPARGVTFELADAAGDETVAWSQWWCRFPNGSVPGWTLHTVRDGQFTFDADFFDVAASKALREQRESASGA